MLIIEEKTPLGSYYSDFQNYGKTPDWLSDLLETAKEIVKGIPWIIKKGDWVTVYNPSTGKWELWPKNLWEAMKRPVTAPPAYTPTLPVYRYTPTPAPTPPTVTPTYPETYPETAPAIEEKTTFEKLMPILMISGALIVLALLLTRK